VITVPAPARSSSPSGSAEVAAISAPRRPTERYTSPVMEWIARARISRSRRSGPDPETGSCAGAAPVGFAILLVAMMITF